MANKNRLAETKSLKQETEGLDAGTDAAQPEAAARPKTAMEGAKEIFAAYFAQYEHNAEHAGHGHGKIGITSDELVEALVDAVAERL